MSLPKLSTPTYKLKIPSSGKTITYRPFLVKEEKLLLMSKESKNPKEIVDTLRNLVTSCVTEQIDFDSLTSFDVEYMFLNFRSKSVGEEVELMIPCDQCEKKNPVSVNLDEDIFVENQDKKIEFKIPLTNTVGLIMKYPSMDSFVTGSMDNDSLGVIISSIEAIYDETTVHKINDYTQKEVRDFISSLSMKDIQKIQNFFNSMPKIKCKVEFKCQECQKDNSFNIEGINNFF